MPFYINLFECWIKDCNITLIGFEWYWEENEQQYKSLSSLLKPEKTSDLKAIGLLCCKSSNFLMA